MSGLLYVVAQICICQLESDVNTRGEHAEELGEDRRAIIESLSGTDPTATELLPILIEGLTDADSRVREVACYASGNCRSTRAAEFCPDRPRTRCFPLSQRTNAGTRSLRLDDRLAPPNPKGENSQPSTKRFDRLALNGFQDGVLRR